MTTHVRPQFHFTASTGWINDPLGITYRDGGYDVFYQYLPDSTRWQPNCHWGHARGPDLLSLRELGVALRPGEGDDGVWTGTVVAAEQGRVHAFYTSNSDPSFGVGRIRRAVPLDGDWLDWRKCEVVATAPDSLDLIAFRDPFLRREGDHWRMFVGAAGRDGTAMALTYVSDNDLETWRYDGVTLARSTHETSPVWTGALWECPQFFEIGDRHAMVSSVWDNDNLHYAVYALGAYADGRFRADTWGRLTYGPSYYAPSLFFDDHRRPCLSFWMRGIADVDAGWAGAHSVPHLLTLEGDRLVARPHPDLERYHAPLGASTSDVGGQALDIAWPSDAVGGLQISRGPQPVAAISCADGEVVIRTGKSVWTVLREGGVRIVVDGPVLEAATGAGNFGAAIAVPPGDLAVRASGGDPWIRGLAR